MSKLEDVCRYIRSKNAGPFWITVDLFFKDKSEFDKHVGSASLTPERLAGVLGAEASQVFCYPVPSLAVLKISYPRKDPQGGVIERDLHGGQQYVRILDLELAT
ncbi:MAG: DUF4387 domain-containing protein [Pseudomonadota bacterium]